MWQRQQSTSMRRERAARGEEAHETGDVVGGHNGRGGGRGSKRLSWRGRAAEGGWRYVEATEGGTGGDIRRGGAWKRQQGTEVKGTAGRGVAQVAAS